jgi:hypothetical protein
VDTVNADEVWLIFHDKNGRKLVGATEVKLAVVNPIFAEFVVVHVCVLLEQLNDTRITSDIQVFCENPVILLGGFAGPACNHIGMDRQELVELCVKMGPTYFRQTVGRGFSNAQVAGMIASAKRIRATEAVRAILKEELTREQQVLRVVCTCDVSPSAAEKLLDQAMRTKV